MQFYDDCKDNHENTPLKAYNDMYFQKVKFSNAEKQGRQTTQDVIDEVIANQ